MEDESVPEDGKPKASDSPDSSKKQVRNEADDQDVKAANDGAVAVAANEPLVKTSDATRTRSNAVAILLPDDNCILFGRGKSCNNHPGNIRMRLVLNKYKSLYQKSVRGEKFKLVRRVYGELKDEGMKFLKPTDGQDGWVEVPAEAAIQKVGHALRNTRVGNNQKYRKIGEPLVADADDGGMSGANAKPTAEDQTARIQGLSSLSMPLGTGLNSNSGGLVRGGAGELVQNSSSASPVRAQQVSGSAVSTPLGAGLLQSAGLVQGSTGGLLQHSSAAAPFRALQEQLTQSALSSVLGTGLPRSGDLVQGRAGELLQHSSSSATLRAAQEQLAASQGLSALSMQLGTNLLSGNSLLPTGRDILGIGGNRAVDPLLLLENHRREVEMQRLRSALLTPSVPATLSGSLPTLSADQIYAIAEREYLLRRDDQLLQLLLHHQLSRDSGSSTGQPGGKNQGERH